jgi:hypothetical protein
MIDTGWPSSQRRRKVSWASMSARVKRLDRLNTSAREKLPYHSVCQRTSVLSLSMMRKNWSM